MHRRIKPALFAGALARALMGPVGAFAQEAQVGVNAGGADDAFLYGAMIRPPGEAPAPFVLMIPGATDRDGNAPAGVNTNTLKLLAEALAPKGVGSLRVDRRGLGASVAAGGQEADLHFDAFVADTVTWAKFLALQPRVKCVVLLGDAEGALVAALAAHQVKTCGVVEIAAAGRPAGALMAGQLKAGLDSGKLSQNTYDDAVKILAELQAGRTVANPPLQLDSLFRPSLQPYLISWLNRDPVEAQKDLAPVLILQGDRDLEIEPDDARRLANLNKRIKLVVLPGVNHVLKAAPLDREGNLATYGNPNLPLGPGVAQAVADFIFQPNGPAGPLSIKLVGAQ